MDPITQESSPSVPPALRLKVKPIDGKFVVEVPVILEMPVDPLDGFTEEEAPQIALDRFASLPLEIHLGGVPLHATSVVPLFSEED